MPFVGTLCDSNNRDYELFAFANIVKAAAGERTEQSALCEPTGVGRPPVSTIFLCHLHSDERPR